MTLSVARRLSVLAALLTLAAVSVSGSVSAIVVGAVLATWLGVAAWRWADITARPRLRFAYYLGLLLLAGAAVALTPYAMFAAWIVSVQAFALFTARSAFAWSVAGALLMTYAQMGSLRPIASTLVSLLAPLLVAGWYLSRESESRRRLNAELADALAQNTALQQRLVDQARTAGMQGERTRMAREIHDTLAQDLSAALALLEGAVADGDREPRVAQARDLTRSNLTEARRSVLALRPHSLADAPLADALDRLVAEWSARTGIAGSFESDPDPQPVAVPVASAVYRVGQSALANVAEHAAASRVQVTLSYLDHEVVLDVRDDGVGFDASARPDADRGFGLVAMRQRLGDLGGTLDVESVRGEGTAIRAAVPT